MQFRTSKMASLLCFAASILSVAKAPAQVVIQPIGEVQGFVADGSKGTASRSPFVGQPVTVQGVVHQHILIMNRGRATYGFFIQNTTATADGIPETSDGILVMTGGERMLDSEQGDYLPTVGDEVILGGNATEIYDMTVIEFPYLVSDVVRTGVDLEAEVPAVAVDPPVEVADADRYWERIEGMRAVLPAGSLVIAGRNHFGEIYMVSPDFAPFSEHGYHTRVFRDPHPLDNNPDEPFDDGNGFRILMGSLGIAGAKNDPDALIFPARTFDLLARPIVGAVYYSYSKYSIQPGTQISTIVGFDPFGSSSMARPDLAREFSIATYNVENLYDYRDDPFDGNDNPDGGFNYTPASQEEYVGRTHEIALQIVHDLHNPDIMMFQEIEDQDIAAMSGASFTVGTRDNADGRPDVLQEVAAQILFHGGPRYEAVFDRDGADQRGITCGFLYRTDRVELLPVSSDDPIFGSNPTIEFDGEPHAMNRDVSNPKAFNATMPGGGEYVFSRSAQVALFRIWNKSVGDGDSEILYVVTNHFSSRPNDRVERRRQQAAINAAIATTLLKADRKALIVIGGDLNVYPRPDDPFTPPDSRYPSDQLAAIYKSGMINTYDIQIKDAPAAAYTYIYQGQAQTLDHLFVSPALKRRISRVRPMHINADWPSGYEGDGARGMSDHDPVLAHFTF